MGAFAAPPKPAETVAQRVDTRLTVPGMRCAGCIGKIERGLGEIPGVNAARVNFTAKRVAVSHTPALTDERLIEELRRLGFEAERASDNPLARDDAETRRLLFAVGVAGFGMMNIMLLSVSVWSGADGAPPQHGQARMPSTSSTSTTCSIRSRCAGNEPRLDLRGRSLLDCGDAASRAARA